MSTDPISPNDPSPDQATPAIPHLRAALVLMALILALVTVATALRVWDHARRGELERVEFTPASESRNGD